MGSGSDTELDKGVSPDKSRRRRRRRQAQEEDEGQMTQRELEQAVRWHEQQAEKWSELERTHVKEKALLLRDMQSLLLERDEMADELARAMHTIDELRREAAGERKEILSSVTLLRQEEQRLLERVDELKKTVEEIERKEMFGYGQSEVPDAPAPTLTARAASPPVPSSSPMMMEPRRTRRLRQTPPMTTPSTGTLPRGMTSGAARAREGESPRERLWAHGTAEPSGPYGFEDFTSIDAVSASVLSQDHKSAQPIDPTRPPDVIDSISSISSNGSETRSSFGFNSEVEDDVLAPPKPPTPTSAHFPSREPVGALSPPAPTSPPFFASPGTLTYTPGSPAPRAHSPTPPEATLVDFLYTSASKNSLNEDEYTQLQADLRAQRRSAKEASPPRAMAAQQVMRQGSIDDFNIIQTLGIGSFGKVVQAISNVDHQVYAIKSVSVAQKAGAPHMKVDTTMKTALAEIKTIPVLKHPYIVKYYDVLYANATIHIVMEYVSGGNLKQRLKAEVVGRNAVWEETRILRYFIKTCLAIFHLHHYSLVHRDIKAENILLTSTDDIKLVDFGLATIIEPGYLSTQPAGTWEYLAPEMAQQSYYNRSCDSWALGVVLYEMMSGGYVPFSKEGGKAALLYRIQHHKQAPVSAIYSLELRRVLDDLLCKDPEKRPFVSDVLQAVFIKNAMVQLLSANERSLFGDDNLFVGVRTNQQSMASDGQGVINRITAVMQQDKGTNGNVPAEPVEFSSNVVRDLRRRDTRAPLTHSPLPAAPAAAAAVTPSPASVRYVSSPSTRRQSSMYAPVLGSPSAPPVIHSSVSQPSPRYSVYHAYHPGAYRR